MSAAAVPPGIVILTVAANERHPASDGAHRLGWWIAEQGDPGAAAMVVAAHCGITVATLERIVLGSFEPGPEVRAAISRATEGAVLVRDWMHGGPLRWRTRPMRRGAYAQGHGAA